MRKLNHLELLAEVKPEKLEPAAVRWHGWLEVESAAMTLAGRLEARVPTGIETVGADVSAVPVPW